MEALIISLALFLIVIIIIMTNLTGGYGIDKRVKQNDKNCKKYRLGIMRFLFFYYQRSSREITKAALIFLIVGYSLNLICLAMTILFITDFTNTFMFCALIACWIVCDARILVCSFYYSKKYKRNDMLAGKEKNMFYEVIKANVTHGSAFFVPLPTVSFKAVYSSEVLTDIDEANKELDGQVKMYSHDVVDNVFAAKTAYFVIEFSTREDAEEYKNSTKICSYKFVSSKK